MAPSLASRSAQVNRRVAHVCVWFDTPKLAHFDETCCLGTQKASPHEQYLFVAISDDTVGSAESILFRHWSPDLAGNHTTELAIYYRRCWHATRDLVDSFADAEEGGCHLDLRKQVSRPHQILQSQKNKPSKCDT